MATSQLTNAVRYLRQAVLACDGGGLPDGQLLERYLARRDEAAFAALVRRHGPMVLGVCRRVLRNPHDADDAFQATFLVLVRKAHSIRPRDMVGNWLHGVAYRTSLKARALNLRRRATERRAGEVARPRVQAEESRGELRALLDQELDRLPDRYRGPVVLCDLEGKTRKEAARQLGWPEGTVATRLTAARKLLAKRLARHGVVLSGSTLAALLPGPAASAGVPAVLLAATMRAAGFMALGQAAALALGSARVTTLTKGVLQAMWLDKLKTALMVVLAAGILGAGVGVAAFAYPIQTADPPATAQPPILRARPPDPQTVPPPPPSASARPPELEEHADQAAAAKDFVVSVQYFEVGPDGLVRTTSPHHRFAIPEGKAEKLLIDGIQRVMVFETDQKIKLYEIEKAETSLEVRMRDLGSDHVLLNLALRQDDAEHAQQDADGMLLRGRSLKIIRKVKIGKLERFILETDGKDRPTSWVELSVVVDSDPPAPGAANARAPSATRGAPKDDKEHRRRTELQGVWKPVAVQIGTSILRGAEIKHVGKLAIDGNRLFPADQGVGVPQPTPAYQPTHTWNWGGTFQLDTRTRPKRITIFDEGPDGELTLNGIYALEGDELRLCFNLDGKDPARPTSFRADARLVLIDFKREKP